MPLAEDDFDQPLVSKRRALAGRYAWARWTLVVLNALALLVGVGLIVLGALLLSHAYDGVRPSVTSAEASTCR